VSVVGWSGRLPVFGGRLFSANRAGLGVSRQFIPLKGSVTHGQDISLRMRSHLWMMRVARFCRASEVAGILIAATQSTLLVTRKVNDG
jgi:hypothetical protein